MEFRSILVNLDVDSRSSDLLRVAIDLAERFGAEISAVAGAWPTTDLVALEGTAIAVGSDDAERKQLEDRLQGLEVDFIAKVPAKLRGSCVTLLAAPNEIVATAARRADLILVDSWAGEKVASRNLDVGALLLSAGRPVLLVADGNTHVSAKTIIVGWKDGREARRAVADAMPLLRSATEVIVAAIDEGTAMEQKASVEDVLAWLRLHGVAANGDVYPLVGTHAETLQSLARHWEADLIVAGAFGHSRMREQLFGGVTRDLLAAGAINRFMSN
jgi:nucleotide-binding universal stress UspA family protein